MAVITRYPLLRHLRVEPTAYIRALRRGKLVHDGPGLAFWFLPLTAAMSEIPLDDRELPLLFHARTADFQDVAVQATVRTASSTRRWPRSASTFRSTPTPVTGGRLPLSRWPEYSPNPLSSMGSTCWRAPC
jgi:hypothetical protein